MAAFDHRVDGKYEASGRIFEIRVSYYRRGRSQMEIRKQSFYVDGSVVSRKLFWVELAISKGHERDAIPQL
jgi:hypothetical protein